MSKKIQLIIGSTRQGRIATQIAPWVEAQVAKRDDIELEIVDLHEWKLPFLDAPLPPAYGPVDTPEAKAWAAKIAASDGVIFLSAEYNRSIPAPLKNAIDYLKVEWENKPAAIVTYGYVDGGASAAKHLLDVFGWLKPRVAQPTVALKLNSDIVVDGQVQNIDASFAPYEADMQAALAELVA
jgi:NAD(P)H-dependent FMN reductase